MEQKKLKPVVFIQGEKIRYSSNTYVQNIILKALSKGITDVQELRRLAGVKTAADVFRTLDKLAIRKEYHTALFKNGITLDTIVSGIKDICNNADKDATKLKALQTLLKSLGLEKYEKVEEGGKNWEEVVMELANKDNNQLDTPNTDNKITEYDVNVPLIPEDEKNKRESEKQIASELYDK